MHRWHHSQKIEEAKTESKEKVVRAVITVIDSVDAALESASDGNNFEVLLDGVEMIRRQFMNEMKGIGMLPIEALNKPFDPNVHEAVEMLMTGEVEPGCVVKQIRRGYLLDQTRIIRPAMVAVE